MSMQNPNRIHASARVTGNPAAFTGNRGFLSVVRNGLGNWSLVYDQELDPLVMVPDIQQIVGAGLPAAIFDVRAETDAGFVVIARDGLGASADVNFSINVFALSSRG